MLDQTHQLVVKQEIYEVVARYARAIDRMDETMLRSVFHDGSEHNHFYIGLSSAPERPATGDDPGDFVRFAMALLGGYKRTHHQLGNTLIELIDEGCATAETYFTAFHRMRAKDDPLCGPDAYETEMDFLVGGRYLDVFRCVDGVWKIASRTGMTDWTRLEAPCAKSLDGIDQSTLGQRYPDDLVYQLGVS